MNRLPDDSLSKLSVALLLGLQLCGKKTGQIVKYCCKLNHMDCTASNGKTPQSTVKPAVQITGVLLPSLLEIDGTRLNPQSNQHCG